jgi:hypothetical protein
MTYILLRDLKAFGSRVRCCRHGVAGNNHGFQSARALALGGGESEAYMALLGLLRFASFARDHWDERASTE